MKKIAATLWTLLISGSAFALPLGNPWEASLMTDGICWEGSCRDINDPCLSWCDAWSIRIGFYGDYVFHHKMELSSRSLSPTAHKVEIYTNAAYLAFNMWDRIDVFATLGGSRIAAQLNLSGTGQENNRRGFGESDTSFSWSIGGRATIWECGCLGLGVEGQYFRSSPNTNFVRSINENPVYADVDFTYYEWQVGIGLAYRINIAYCSTALVPYIGAKVNRARFDDFGMEDWETDRDWGYALGVTLLGCNKGSVTVEGRFANESAVYVNSQVRF